MTCKPIEELLMELNGKLIIESYPKESGVKAFAIEIVVDGYKPIYFHHSDLDKILMDVGDYCEKQLKQIKSDQNE